MSAARRTQNGASANARRTTSAKKGSTAASSRRTSSATRSTTKTKKPSSSARAKSTQRRSRRMTLAFLICLGVFIAAVWTLYPVLRLQYQQQREVASLEAELEGLKERNTELSAQIDRLKTPEGVEEVARQNLGLVKDGEQAYVVTGKDDPELADGAVAERTRSTIDDQTPLWMKVLDALFGVR